MQRSEKLIPAAGKYHYIVATRPGKKDAEQIPRDPNENTAVSFFPDVCIRGRATHRAVAQIAYNQEIDGVELLVDNRPSPFGSPLLSR